MVKWRLAKIHEIADTYPVMNAVELIEQFKRLPQSEQGKVVEFIQRDASAKVRYADDKTALAAAKEVFEEHPELFRKLAQ